MSAISRRPWDLGWLGLGAALGLGVGAAVRLLLGTRTATLGGQPRRPHQATA
jgi:hypothetical protein